MSKVSPALFMALGAQLYTRMGLANRLAPAVTTVVTNVPGPPVPIYSAGARLESMMGLVCLTDGMGLGHVVQSYVDEATITITADRKLLPDPEFYSQCIQDSFDELLAAANDPANYPANRPASAEPKPAAKRSDPPNAKVASAKPAKAAKSITKTARAAPPRGKSEKPAKA